MKREHLLYFFLVIILTAFSACGGGSAGSSAGVVATPGGSPGGSPGGPPDSATENEGTIKLAWDSTSELDLAGYKLHYGTSSGAYQNSIDVGMATPAPENVITYTLTGLVKGQIYFIAVTAYDTSSQESDFSNEVNGVAG